MPGLLDRFAEDNEPRGLLAPQRERMAQLLLSGYEGMPAPQPEGMPKHDPGFLARLAKALATMPTVQSIKSAVTLPGDVYAGRTPMGLPSQTEDLTRVADLAGLAMTGGVAGTGAGGVALGAGFLRPAIRYNGKIYKAPEGSKSHIDALEAIPDPKVRDRATWDGDTRGYVDESGKYYDRRRAQDYALKEDLIDPAAPAWARTSPELIAENLRLPPPKEKPNVQTKYDQREIDALAAMLSDKPKGDQTLGSGATDKRGAAAMGIGIAGADQPIANLGMGSGPIRAYHGSPHDFDRFDADSIAWLSTDRSTARAFGRDRMGLSPGQNNRIEPRMYEVEVPEQHLKTIDPMAEATQIAEQIGVPRPQTWDEAADILQWADAQKGWIDEARNEGFKGVRFVNVGDSPNGAVSTHIAVMSPEIISILKKYGVASFAALPPAVQMALALGETPPEPNADNKRD